MTDAPPPDAVAAYKTLLRELVARRPSGTRARMAAAFGTHPSFVSQIINPALRVPLPAQHIPALLRICHFSPDEKARFLALYARAHPAQSGALHDLAAAEADVLRVPLPAFADAETRDEVAALISDFADRVISLARKRP